MRSVWAQSNILCCQHTGQKARGGGTLGHCYSSSKTLSGERCMGLLLSLLFGLDDISLTGAEAVLGYTSLTLWYKILIGWFHAPLMHEIIVLPLNHSYAFISSLYLSMTGAPCATCSFFPHSKGQPKCPPTPNLVSWISRTSQRGKSSTHNGMYYITSVA